MSLAGKKAREAQLAFVFLTRLPVGRLPDPTPDLKSSVWAFQLVGLVVGTLSGAVFFAAAQVLPTLAAALLALTAAIFLTGALHEDGLADVADGFGGGPTREAKLAIMRDSRIGSYGVVALVLVLALIAVAMAETQADLGAILQFAAVGMISRAAMIVPMAILPPARVEGLGHSASLPPGVQVWISLIPAGVLALWVHPFVLLAAITASLVMTWLAHRQIRGQTGDVLGATQKLTECALWLTITAL